MNKLEREICNWLLALTVAIPVAALVLIVTS
jgi:hypothetical protein